MKFIEFHINYIMKIQYKIFKIIYASLTHGRVKNGFNGPNRKLLASNKCPAGDLVVKKVAVRDAQRRGARIGGIGSKRIGSRCHKKKNSKRKC